MILLFLVDTSYSMRQKTPQGLSLLDAAKASIEQFIKIRNKDPSNSKSDKYLLVTCDDGTGCIKISFKHSFVQFQEAYKSLEANSLTQIGNSLNEAFELLNGVRNVDNYGHGLYPFYIEPASIIVLTDGGEFTNSVTITDQLIIPSNSTNVSYTIEPFRWDQRVFALVYNFASELTISPLEPICEVTGGAVKIVNTIRSIYPILEELNAKICQIGVMVSFDGPSEVISSHKMLFVKQTNGYWPIPENYLPTHQIMPRSAQPTILLSEYKEFSILDKFPVDQYEIESCNLTRHVLTTNQTYLTFINNSKGPGLGDPFGFVRAKGSSVYLFVLPYNFFKLFSLCDDLVNVHKLIPSVQWRQELDKYLLSIPPYYVANLKPILKTKYSINSNVEEFKRSIKKKPTKEFVDPVEPERMDRFELQANLAKMRSELFGEVLIGMNAIPIHEMGNFQETLSKRQVVHW
jgi:integrator complex subunit 6